MSLEDEEMWQRIVAERGDEPTPCCYCGITTRPFSEWAAGAQCVVCRGTMDSPPPLHPCRCVPGHRCVADCQDSGEVTEQEPDDGCNLQGGLTIADENELYEYQGRGWPL